MAARTRSAGTAATAGKRRQARTIKKTKPAAARAGRSAGRPAGRARPAGKTARARGAAEPAATDPPVPRAPARRARRKERQPVATDPPVPRAPARRARRKERQPDTTELLKKAAAISDSAAVLSEEIRSMTAIFGENQKILASMSSMIDSLTSALGHIDGQSRQLAALERDTKKLFSGLDQVRTQSGMISKVGDQAARLEARISAIQEREKTRSDAGSAIRQLSESAHNIQDSLDAIPDLARRINRMQDALEKLAAGAQSQAVLSGLAEVRTDLKSLSDGSADLGSLRQSIDALAADVSSMSDVPARLDGILEQAKKADSIRADLSGMRGLLEASDVPARLADVAERLAAVESKLAGAEEARPAEGVADLRTALSEGIAAIQDAIRSLSDRTRNHGNMASEFYGRADPILADLHSGGATGPDAGEPGLSEYRSYMVMLSEPKHGTADDLKSMASQTVQMRDALGRSGRGQLVPHTTRWAVSRMLDCADRWDVRFSDVLSVLDETIGMDALKECVDVRQVRDIYGARAADELAGIP